MSSKQEKRRKHRAKAVKENSSNFVEQFSRQCHDSGMIERSIGVQLFARSEVYGINYDRINWNS